MVDIINTKKIKELPSGYKVYPEGTEIRFDPVTVGEKLHLSESDLSTKQIYEYTLDKIHTTGIDKKDITFPDFIYIGVMRRLYSDEDVLVTNEVYCPVCGHKNVYQFSLSQIEFDELEIPDCPLKINFEGATIVMKPLTIGNVLDLWEKTEATLLDTYVAMIDKIIMADKREVTKKDDISALIGNSSGELVELLQEADKLLYHGLREREVRCTNKEFKQELDDRGNVKKVIPCNHVWKEDLGSPATIIFPSRKSDGDIRSKITFG